MEHLFRLKKDGKTVGYLDLMGIQYPSPDHKPMFCGVRFQKVGEKNWSKTEIEWDIACPFVTKDRNDKDVFVDDKISFILAEGFGITGQYTGTIYYCESRLAFCINAMPSWDIQIKYNCSDILLIENE